MSTFTLFGIPYTLPISLQLDLLTSLSIIGGAAVIIWQQFTAKKTALRKERFLLVKQLIEQTSSLWVQGQRCLAGAKEAHDFYKATSEAINEATSESVDKATAEAINEASFEAEANIRKAKENFSQFQWAVEDFYNTSRLTLAALEYHEVVKVITDIRDGRNRITADGNIDLDKFDLLLTQMEKAVASLGVKLKELI